MQHEKLRKIIRKILKEEDETLYQVSSGLNLPASEDVNNKRKEYYNDMYLFLKGKIEEEEENSSQRNKVKEEIISQAESRLKDAMNIVNPDVNINTKKDRDNWEKREKKYSTIKGHAYGGRKIRQEPASIKRERESAQREIKEKMRVESELLQDLIEKLSSL